MPREDLLVTIDNPEHNAMRLDRWLRENCGSVPFSVMQKALRKGDIRVNKGRVKGDTRLAVGDELRLPPLLMQAYQNNDDEGRETLSPEEITFIRDLVIYEDKDIFTLNKPHGLATQGGTNLRQSVDRLLDGLIPENGANQQRPRLVHRLDRGTSGVLILARHRQAASWIGKDLQEKRVAKLYLAVTIALPTDFPIGDHGVIDAPLKKQGKGRAGGEGAMMVIDPNGDAAQTLYRVLATNPDTGHSLVAMAPLTGRTHQLRVHMHSIGAPIYGDAKYGGRPENARRHIPLHLHCAAMRLKPNHDKKGQDGIVTITADLPEHMIKTIGHFVAPDRLDKLVADAPNLWRELKSLRHKEESV